MSFVYAYYSEDGFSVIADTKIGINDRLLNLWPSESMIQNVKNYGIIKNMILNPHLVLCFAGNNIALADQLLDYYKKGNVELDDIIECAYSIHRNAETDAIEFIIAYCDDEKQRIVSIKNGKVEEGSFAWIGSLYTYREFRKRATEKYPLGISSVEEVISLITESIKSEVDDSVGGYIIYVSYLKYEHSFQYMEQFIAAGGFKAQYIKPGESVKIVQGADQGSYTYHIYQSPERVAIYVIEPQYGIIYTNGTDDEANVFLKNLFMPQLFKMDQIDFDAYAWQLKAVRGIFLGNCNNEVIIKEIKSR